MQVVFLCPMLIQSKMDATNYVSQLELSDSGTTKLAQTDEYIHNIFVISNSYIGHCNCAGVRDMETSVAACKHS